MKYTQRCQKYNSGWFSVQIVSITGGYKPQSSSMPGGLYQNCIYLRVLIGIRIDSGENPTRFSPMIWIKIRKTKSVQCFADFFIKVVGGFLPSIKYSWIHAVMQTKLSKEKYSHYYPGLVWLRKVTHLPRRKSTKTERKNQTKTTWYRVFLQRCVLDSIR